MLISESKKEEIRQAVDILEVIGEYVKLKKQGSYFVGLSPFKKENTPSFTVSPRLNIFKDFSTGIGGDVFKFLMELEGWTFPETLKYLAERYHVPLPKMQDDEQEKQESAEDLLRQGILHALNFAGLYYFRQLKETEEAERARKYLEERKFDIKTIRKFGLGYSPRKGDAFFQEAMREGISIEYLIASGLVKQSERNETEFYDFFRGRLMFPIFDVQKRVIAFGGRVLGNEKTAKYINSNETLVYHKSKVLYGLHLAKNEIRKDKEVILVEGYTDVMRLHQYGIENAVASSGTALTSEQLKLIKRYGNTIHMNYDGDSAGQNAMMRGIKLALNEDLSVRVLALPDKEDPDSFVRQFGAEAFIQQKKENSADFITFMVQKSKNEGYWDDPQGQKTTVEVILETIAELNDSLTKETCINKLSQLSNIGTLTLFDKLKGIEADLKKQKERQAELERRIEERERQQQMDIPADGIPLPSEEDGFYVTEDGEYGYIDTQTQIEQRYEKPKAKPAYEKEILRLMMAYGNEMVEFVGNLINSELFEDEDCTQLFDAIIKAYQDDQSINEVTFAYDDKYSALVAEILLEKEKPSDRHKEKVGMEYVKDKNPINSARYTIKTIMLQYLGRLKKDCMQRYIQCETDEDKRLISEELLTIGKETKRVQFTRAEELFPYESDSDTLNDKDEFVYKRPES